MLEGYVRWGAAPVVAGLHGQPVLGEAYEVTARERRGLSVLLGEDAELGDRAAVHSDDGAEKRTSSVRSAAKDQRT